MPEMTIRQRLFDLAGMEPFTVPEAATRLGLTEKQVRGAIDSYRELHRQGGGDVTVVWVDDLTFRFVAGQGT